MFNQVYKIPEYVLVYCGTNDLRQDISAVEIAKKIIEIAVSCKLKEKTLLLIRHLLEIYCFAWT